MKSKLKRLSADKRAVSPVIGVIMMIAITVVIAAVVASFSYGIIGGVKKAPSASLVIEDADVGNENITIVHRGGDTIVDAFGGNDWDSMEVRVNGGICDTNGHVSLNGTWGIGNWNVSDFEPGDELEINVSAAALNNEPLDSGDSISVVYTPTGDTLTRIKVR